jgi:hypothetical protein
MEFFPGIHKISLKIDTIQVNPNTNAMNTLACIVLIVDTISPISLVVVVYEYDVIKLSKMKEKKNNK